MEERTRELIGYWDRRAPSYTEVIRRNLEGEWDRRWADMLISRFPAQGDVPLRILDIGTGPGFYAIILAERNYRVTAVDYAEKMLAEARNNAGSLGERICFRQMDAHSLDFPDGSFDVIVTRNLTCDKSVGSSDKLGDKGIGINNAKIKITACADFDIHSRCGIKETNLGIGSPFKSHLGCFIDEINLSMEDIFPAGSLSDKFFQERKVKSFKRMSSCREKLESLSVL